MMGVRILLLAATLSTLGGQASGTPYRCLIEPKSVERAFKGSAAVFLGEVVKVKIAEGMREARFNVSEVWKGADVTEVVVYEPANSAESPNYQAGVSYLVFAGVRDGRLFTGMCSRTKPAAQAQSDLRQLGEGQKPKSERR